MSPQLTLWTPELRARAIAIMDAWIAEHEHGAQGGGI